jgi:hypothetical protein
MRIFEFNYFITHFLYIYLDEISSFVKNIFMKGIFKKVLISFGIIVSIVFLSFSRYNSNSLVQSKVDYSGTNSLFIEYGDKLNFHWITSVIDTGYYELIDTKGSLVSKGTTLPNRPHSVSIKHKIKNGALFKFGGLNDGIFEIKLREKKKLSDSYFKNVDSIFVVGDVHGRYDQLINLLQKATIIDSQLSWTGGNNHLVFLGDLFDRGDNVTKVLWFIYDLEEKAKIAGGEVHLVLGNHEIMIMSKDLRYLSRKEASIAIAHKTTYDYLFHPTKSLLGSWLTSKTSVLKIDDVLFAHGGVVELETNSIKGYNGLVNSKVKDPMFLDIMQEYPDSTKYNPIAWNNMRYFFYREDAPFWFRGYVQSDTLGPTLRSMLLNFNSKVHVVAHTIQKTITSRYNGKLLTTDLEDAATELLLIIKNKRKYENYKIDSFGKISEVK